MIVGSDGMRVQGKDLTRAKQEKITAALAKYGRVEARRRSASATSARRGVSRSAARRCARSSIFFFVIALYLSLRFTIKMAIVGDHRGDPRHRDHHRRLRDHRVRGDTRDGHRVPDHPGVLALRHRRRVRQDQGERTQDRHRQGPDVHGHGEPLAQRSAHAVAEHLVRRAAPGRLPPRRGRLDLRSTGAAGLRSRAVRGPAHRCLLVDLRRDPDPGLAEGAGAEAPRGGGAGGDPGPAAAAPEYQGEPAEPEAPVPAAARSRTATVRAAPAPAAAPSDAPAITPRPRQQKGRKRK